MSFADLNLIPEIQRAVADEGYTEPTPIQAKAIPAVLERRDIMGCAQTGTGKTAGFTLPLLQLLSPYANSSPSPARHPVRALILTPTRELAAQVSDSVKTYGKHLKLRSTVVYGGVDMPPQTKALREGVEILVATPGRLLDHVQQKSVSLGQVEILVLDEADRMLDMGFLPDIRRILALLPTQRQSLLFSATFSDEIKKLANQMLRNPTLIEVARRNAPADLVDHQVYEVEAARKRSLLAQLIRSRDMKQVLVFVRMKRDCNRLARELVRDGINATAIHSDRTQAEREQALADFKEGRATALVATDIAARGIDIAELPFVINYELPYTPEDYVHRIGRTGRAGMTGEAISLVSAEENRLLVEIEKLLKRAIPRKTAEGGEPERTRERRPHREHREEAVAKAKPRPAHRHQAPRIASDGFDFSKPYEPSPSAQTKPEAEKPLPARPRGGRPTAALLGGLAAKK
ncbi:MAG: DEAD/DEAH box helicase [Burkholderiales bacterium]|jgi:ATP-dependent RNA helicase RhlE|nr:DEAD/DEAH box helicase [Burkholderiales bacterium]